MATNAKIWYTPFQRRTAVEINLQRPLSSLEDYDVSDEAVSESLSGSRTKVTFNTRRAVDVGAVLLDDATARRQLEGLVSHLRAGGLCSVAEVGTTTFAAYLSYQPTKASATIHWKTQLYKSFGGVYTPALGDILVLQGPSPRMRWSEVEVVSGSTKSATLTEAPVENWERADWVLVRTKGFWPALRLRSGAGANVIDHGNRITYDLRLPLEVPPNAYDAMAVAPNDPIDLDAEDSPIDIRVLQIGDWQKPPFDGGVSSEVSSIPHWLGW